MTKLNVSQSFNGKPSDSQIDSLEKTFGMRLPIDYRKFLMTYHALAIDGSDGDALTFPIEGFGIVVLNYIFGINQKDYDVETEMKRYKNRVPENCLPIADDPAGNLFLLHTPSGSVYFWDHENEGNADSNIEKSKNIYKVTESFSQLIKGAEI
jgi:hypothetical protein